MMDDTYNQTTVVHHDGVPMYTAGIVIGAILIIVALELIFRGAE